MLNILLVSAPFPPEPVVSARLSFDIAQRVYQNGKHIVVLSPKPSRPHNYAFPTIEIQLPYEHVNVDSYVCPQSKVIGRFIESLSFGKATLKYIQQHHKEIDVIYANTWPLFAQLFLAKAAKQYRIPYYIHVQDVYPESYCNKMPKGIGAFLYRILVPIDKYVLRNAEGVFAISPAMKSYLSQSREIDDSRVILVRNWQDDRIFIDSYKPLDNKQNSIKVMYLGSINPTANVPLIIRAFSHLDRKRFDLSIVGNGPEKLSCQKLAKQLGIEIVFDTVSPDDVAEKQSQADILVLCLKSGVAQTATPSKLTAYMLTGRPIIASVDLTSDCSNIIREAKCGVVVAPDNEWALCEAIHDLAEKSMEERNRLGHAAFEYAKNNLSKERNLSIIVDKIIKD